MAIEKQNLQVLEQRTRLGGADLSYKYYTPRVAGEPSIHIISVDFRRRFHVPRYISQTLRQLIDARASQVQLADLPVLGPYGLEVEDYSNYITIGEGFQTMSMRAGGVWRGCADELAGKWGREGGRRGSEGRRRLGGRGRDETRRDECGVSAERRGEEEEQIKQKHAPTKPHKTPRACPHLRDVPSSPVPVPVPFIVVVSPSVSTSPPLLVIAIASPNPRTPALLPPPSSASTYDGVRGHTRPIWGGRGKRRGEEEKWGWEGKEGGRESEWRGNWRGERAGTEEAEEEQGTEGGRRKSGGCGTWDAGSRRSVHLTGVEGAEDGILDGRRTWDWGCETWSGAGRERDARASADGRRGRTSHDASKMIHQPNDNHKREGKTHRKPWREGGTQRTNEGERTLRARSGSSLAGRSVRIGAGSIDERYAGLKRQEAGDARQMDVRERGHPSESSGRAAATQAFAKDSAGLAARRQFFRKVFGRTLIELYRDQRRHPHPNSGSESAGWAGDGGEAVQ
ncbi:hypothetical protein B0H13DRAFT_1891821 [Mycena leptocephala]|nr:hypothetical protein B0H13DRAFT_1891821 [Mycena leptocephala]